MAIDALSPVEEAVEAAEFVDLAPQTAPDDDDDELIREITIDGMCGVY